MHSHLLIIIFNTMVLEKTILGTKEVALYTGYSLHSIYFMIKNNTIPYYKPNRKVLFKKDDIDLWISSNRRQTKKEIEDTATKLLKSSR